MNNEELRNTLETEFSGDGFRFVEFAGELTWFVPRERIVEVCRHLREDEGLKFNYLHDVTAVDQLNAGQKPRFEVVYHLYSVGHYHRIRLKALVPEEDPRIDSVISIWSGADYAEREVYDLFGIEFEGHPDLKRILMPEDWQGHPLRKDFPLGGSRSFYYKHDTNEYAGEPKGFVPRIRVQEGDV